MSKYVVGQTVFVTLWALSAGVKKTTIDVVLNERTAVALRGFPDYFEPDADFFGDIEDAQRDVRARAEAKLESLEKQAAKLRKIVDNGARVKEVGK